MTELHITRGIPASGKSTFAKAWVLEEPYHRARVNRDDIRWSQFGKGWDVDERAVTDIQNAMIRSLISRGYDVIVDNTNLKARDVKSLVRVARNVYAETEVVFHDFSIGVEKAVLRDGLRNPRVGEETIRAIASRYLRNGYLPPVPDTDSVEPEVEIKPYVANKALPEAYLFDIDGTLAYIQEGGRSPYDGHRVGEDGLHSDVAYLLFVLRQNFDIVLVSGRSEDYRDITEDWLEVHGISYDALYMRPSGDNRRDDIIKSEILDRDIAPSWNVLGVFDDRDRVVAGWRARGVRCYQVNPGNF